MTKICTFAFLFLLIWFGSVSAIELQFEIDPSDENALPSAISKTVDSAYDMNQMGLTALEKKQYDVALEFFENALSILPDYSDALNNKGVVYFRRGIISDAQKVWEELAVKDPSYAIASYNLGLIYLHEHQLEAAQRLFERALKIDSKLVEAYVRLGMVTIQRGSKEKGLEYLKKAYKINPSNQDVWCFLAHGLILCGDTSGAITTLLKKEDNSEALRMLGIIENNRHNYTKAENYLLKAVAKGAEPSLLVDLASTQLDNGKCTDAQSVLKRYFDLNIQHSADSWLLAGIASKDCGDLTSAQKYFEEGVKRYPQDAILKYNLGQVYFHNKLFDKADQTWDGLTDSLQDPSLLYLRAFNAKKRNKLEEAKKLIDKALTMDDRAEFHDFLGVIYHLNNDNSRAEDEFRKALKINPELRSAQLNLALSSKKAEDAGMLIKEMTAQLSSCPKDTFADISFQLALVYYNQKDVTSAIKVLEAVKLEDRDDRIYRHLAIFYRENHDFDKAIAVLEEASKRLVLEPQIEYELAETYLLAGYYAKAADALTSLLPKWKQNPWRLHYQLGYAFMEANEMEKAKQCFQKSLNSKPGNVAAQGLLAFVYNRQGNIAEARRLWEKNLKDDPNNPAIWINMGLSVEKDGKYREALDYYLKAASLKSTDKELQINIGNAYSGLDRYTEALDAYNQALSSEKRELAAYNIFLVARKKKDKDKAAKMLNILKQEYSVSLFTKRADAEMSLWNGDTTKAISMLESISDKDGGDFLSLAGIYAAKGNSEKTNMYLAKVSGENQYDKTVKSIQAQLAFKTGDYQTALKYLKESGDNSFASKYNIALAAYNAKQEREALSLIQQIIATVNGPDRADCCRLAGNAAFAIKEWKTALGWYLQLSAVDANNSIVQYNLAVASYNLNDIQNAWKYYQRARTLDTSIQNKDIESKYKSSIGEGEIAAVKDSSEIWYNSAVDFQNNGNDSAAEKLYLKILEKDPAQSLAWNNLGAIYGARGNIDNAEKAYFKAIDKRHDIPETYANLVNLYIELEEFAKARQWIIKGLGHNPDSQMLMDLKGKIVEAEKASKEKKKE